MTTKKDLELAIREHGQAMYDLGESGDGNDYEKRAVQRAWHRVVELLNDITLTCRRIV